MKKIFLLLTIFFLAFNNIFALSNPIDNLLTNNNMMGPSIRLEKTGVLNDDDWVTGVSPGDTIDYTFTITNTGDVDLTNVIVNDALITVNGAPITLVIGATDATTFTGTYTIQQSDIDAGELVNTATVTGIAPDSSTVTDTSDDPTDPTNIDSNGDGDPDDPTITLLTNLRIFLYADGSYQDTNGDGVANIGDNILYTFGVYNTGNVTVSNLSIDDATLGLTALQVIPGTLDPTESGSATYLYAITQADIDAGAVYNTATANGTDLNGNPVTDDSEDPTPISPSDPFYNLTNCPDCTIVTLDYDGDGIADVNEPLNTIFDPCLPVQAPGYTGYNANNTIWQQGNCDNDNFLSNGTEVILGSDPYSANNRIMGTILFDENDDGCENDSPSTLMRVNISNGTITSSTFLNNAAEYNFFTETGIFTVTPNLENPTFFNISPIDATFNFTDVNYNVATQDFCITANGVQNDVEIVIAPITTARPGFDAVYLLTYKNKGNQVSSGNFNFMYNDAVLDYVTATVAPTTQAAGVLNWNYTNLQPFESRSINVILNVNGPTETPAINIGNVLDFSATINPAVTDVLPDDNTINYNQTVVGSYDPNDITCVEGDVLEPSEIGEYLHYIINFENTGNAYAQNIVVVTEIDPAMFNINTLRILSTSHDAYIRVKDNRVEIVFDAIYLDSGGHGTILLKIKSQDGLEVNDTVLKKADIFFDYNFPIETNTAITTYALLSASEFELDKTVSLYPNPVKNTLTILAKYNITNVSLFDVQGRVLYNRIGNEKEVKVDLSTRANGVYFVKITTDKGEVVKKVIKD